MHVFINGQARPCERGVTVAALLHDLGYTGKRVAVEINREIVPRSRHADHQLQDQDRVEVVNAIGGG